MDQPGSTDPWAPSTGQYYSTDPADLFAQLYDAIPDSVFLGWDAMKWNDSAPVRRQALEISTAILESGEVDTAHVEELIEEHGPRGMFTVLLGLDWTLIYVNPYGPAFGDVNLTNLQLRYAERQLLNSTAVSGALLPRCTFPGRPRGKLDKAEFFGVHRIPAEQWAKVEHRSVPPELDRHFNRSRPVPVACAPVIETLDELKIEFAERHGAAVFTLRPVNSAKLRSRLDTLLYRLDTSGARIAVLPEGTLSDSLLRHWRTLIDSRTDDLGTPTGLDFLLVGSGPVGSGQAPTNRAVLLHRHSGTELLSQDKLNSFTLDPDQTKLWRLRDAPATRTAAEYSTQGAKIGVLESSLGRLAILICEDFVRTAGWERELLACGVSHLLVPIFSKPILRYRWEQQSAERQAIQLGCWMMVSNSLAVDHAVPIGGLVPDGQAEGSRYSFLVAGPPDPDSPSYRPRLQFGVAKAGDEPGFVDDADQSQDSRQLPWVYPGAAHD